MATPLQFDGQRATEDMAAQGLDARDVARLSGLSLRTIYRFMAGDVRKVATARRFAQALGYSTRRYLVRSEAA